MHPGRLTREKALEMAADDEMIVFAVHPAMIPSLWDWLDASDIDLAPGPVDEDGEPVYIASPRNLGGTDGGA